MMIAFILHHSLNNLSKFSIISFDISHHSSSYEFMRYLLRSIKSAVRKYFDCIVIALIFATNKFPSRMLYDKELTTNILYAART